MNVRFTKSAFADYRYWQQHDHRKVTRIQKLCIDIQKNPFEGIGKPEPLKFDLQGYWSRRIDRTHRLVYTVKKQKIMVISCRYHY
jgi:toxin YoeB